MILLYHQNRFIQDHLSSFVINQHKNPEQGNLWRVQSQTQYEDDWKTCFSCNVSRTNLCWFISLKWAPLCVAHSNYGGNNPHFSFAYAVSSHAGTFACIYSVFRLYHRKTMEIKGILRLYLNIPVSPDNPLKSLSELLFNGVIAQKSQYLGK